MLVFVLGLLYFVREGAGSWGCGEGGYRGRPYAETGHEDCDDLLLSGACTAHVQKGLRDYL